MSFSFLVVLVSEMFGPNYPTTVTNRKSLFLTLPNNIMHVYIMAMKYLALGLSWSATVR